MSRSKRNWDVLIGEDGNYDIQADGGGGGEKGQKGEPGPSGGAKGQKGEQGTAGTNGSVGATGAKGQKGQTGLTGPGGTGDKGQKGEQGTPGAASAKGDKGQKGSIGTKGNPGEGDKGQKGQAGDDTKGQKGQKGIQGDFGPKGEKGIDAAKGEDGDKGEKGTKGADIQGIKGQKGEKGEAAPVLQFQGNVADQASLPAQPQPAGDTYYAVAEGRYFSSDGAAWSDAGQMIKGEKGQDIKGEKGPKGTKGGDGTDGADGDKGAKGQKGLKGINGSKGEKGADGPIGPKGEVAEKGQKGVKGEQGVGDKGQKGAPAPLLQFRGNAANQAALPAQPVTAGDTYLVVDEDLYYTSDGSAWNQSGTVVKGEKGFGEKGEDGIKGVKGQKGQKGAGEKGEGGDKGTKGQKGDDGTKGEKGIGEKGEKGSKGEPEKGQKGAPAPLLLYRGNVATVGDLPDASTNPDVGDTYLVETTDIYYSWNGTAWQDAGQAVKGQKGQMGLIGDKGEKGGIGNKGDKGDKGDKGQKGQKGLKGGDGRMPAAGVTAHASFRGTADIGEISSADIYASHAISSISKLATGQYRITFENAFTANNAYTAIGGVSGGGISLGSGISTIFLNQQADRIDVITERGDNGNQYDADTVHIAFYGTGTGGAIVQKGEKGNFGGQKGQKGQKGTKGEKGQKGQKGLKGLMPVGAASAHVAFDGSAGNSFNFATDVSSSFNVSNITRNASGEFSIFWESAFADANYTIIASAGGRDHSATTGSNRAVNVLSRFPDRCTILVESGGGTNDDADYVALCVYGTGSQGNVTTGPKGEQGEKGDAGGQKGQKGEKGEKGQKGQKGLKGQIPAGAVTAHISFNGEASNGTLAAGDIFSSFGITSIVKNGTGDYTVNFSTPFTADNSYTMTGTAGGTNFTASSRTVNPVQLLAGSCNFVVERSGSGNQDDVPYVSLIFYGDGQGGAISQKGEKGIKGNDTGIQGEKGQKGSEGDVGFLQSFAAFDATAGSSFNWATDAIAQENIASVTRDGAAEYTVNFTTAYAGSDYVVQVQAMPSDNTAGWANVTSRTPTSVTFITRKNGSNYNDTGSAASALNYISIIVMGQPSAS